MKKLLGLCVLVGSMSAFGAEPNYKAGDCLVVKRIRVKVVFLEIDQPNYIMDYTRHEKTSKVTRDIAKVDKLFIEGEEIGLVTRCE